MDPKSMSLYKEGKGKYLFITHNNCQFTFTLTKKYTNFCKRNRSKLKKMLRNYKLNVTRIRDKNNSSGSSSIYNLALQKKLWLFIHVYY